MSRKRGRFIAVVLACCLVMVAGAFAPAVAASLVAAVGVVDFGAPSAFIFAFSNAIPPLNAPVQATLSLTGIMTDDGGDGVSMTPSSLATLVEGSLESVFVLGLGSGFSVSDADSDQGTTLAFNISSTVLFAGGAPPYESMEINLAFTGSGGGDIYALTMTYEVVPASGVPEPATFTLVAAGVVALGIRACGARSRRTLRARR